MRFIATTNVGRCTQKKELEEEAEARDVSRGIESERMEDDDCKENGEDR